MPSPFPGMDPYLETPAYWPDFHSRFINYLAETLSDVMPDNYEARIDERINLVGHPDGGVQLVRPDDSILQQPRPATGAPIAQAGALVLEPVTIPLIIEEEVRETRVEILHRPERSLVTVLELLSPSNKYDPGWGDYLSKRLALLARRVHLVELDLLKGGHRILLRRPLPPGDNYALVARSDRRPNCDVYTWTVRQPLPTIPIPLKAPDPDIRLDLSAVFALTYERGRYARSLDYRSTPPASLDPEDRVWAEALARERAPSAGLGGSHSESERSSI